MGLGPPARVAACRENPFSRSGPSLRKARLPRVNTSVAMLIRPGSKRGLRGAGRTNGPSKMSSGLLARHNAWRYYHQVIRSFRDADTERLFNRELVRRFGMDVQRVALRRLRQLDAAMVLDDLRVPPDNRLEKLRGKREGQFSIRINDQWRLCFHWREGDAYDVEIVDYH